MHLGRLALGAAPLRHYPLLSGANKALRSRQLKTHSSLKALPRWPNRRVSSATVAPEEAGSGLIDAVRKNGPFVVFGGLFGGVIVMLYRSSAASSAFDKERDKILETCVLDSSEQIDLMVENKAFSTSIYDDITRSLSVAFPSGR